MEIGRDAVLPLQERVASIRRETAMMALTGAGGALRVEVGEVDGFD
jgi:hypothetical protein